PPGVAVIAVFTVCRPAEPEPVGHRLFGHPNVDRMVMVVDDIELRRAAGRPVTKPMVAQRCLDREASLRHREIIAIWSIELHGRFIAPFQLSAHNANWIDRSNPINTAKLLDNKISLRALGLPHNPIMAARLSVG